MTMYEVIMIMLAFLTLIVSLLTHVVKMLLFIIDKNAKKYLPRSRQKFEVDISNI
ncbi:putative holin-like toxin [Catenibacterium mitsuokai]|uniref:putative holin-like toxin n=2 Tax=Catenibacterium TaxID=135858 RepID=UPI0039AF8C3F